MPKEKPLIDREFVLQRYPGKGGWTFAEIPEIPVDSNNPFGWVRVKGFIDNYALKQFRLMPMGNGKLFLSVRGEIRRRINKKAGDKVKVILYPDQSPVEIPEDIQLCFENEPSELLDTFRSFSEGEQKAYIDWVNIAKTDESKSERISKMMSRLEKGLKFHDRE